MIVLFRGCDLREALVKFYHISRQFGTNGLTFTDVEEEISTRLKNVGFEVFGYDNKFLLESFDVNVSTNIGTEHKVRLNFFTQAHIKCASPTIGVDVDLLGAHNYRSLKYGKNCCLVRVKQRSVQHPDGVNFKQQDLDHIISSYEEFVSKKYSEKLENIFLDSLQYKMNESLSKQDVQIYTQIEKAFNSTIISLYGNKDVDEIKMLLKDLTEYFGVDVLGKDFICLNYFLGETISISKSRYCTMGQGCGYIDVKYTLDWKNKLISWGG